MVDKLNTLEVASCEIVDAPGNYHFEGRCEDCDIKTMSGLNMDQVEGRYYSGRLSQDQYEAFVYVFERLSPYRGKIPAPAAEFQAVRRIARKLMRIRDFEIPADLVEVATV